MKGLDDGPDGLNEEAFDRALGLGKRQRIPVVRETVVPSARLAEAIDAMDGVEFETKSSSNGDALYRYTCRCGSRGVWHRDPAIARSVAQIHAQAVHAQSENSK